jgi:UDP:flavonoid glycosyltransferase YjiC (YdhE family)
VPQIAFPIGFDQTGTAARVAYHGLGVVGSFRAACPDTIHALVSRVLADPAFRHRAAAMRDVFHAHERAQTAAVLLEQWLQA